MMATGHMLFNVSIVVLFLVATILGWDHGALAGGRLTAVIVLQAIGVGILGLSGWLGGEMIFRHHLAMVPDDSELEAAEQRRHSEGWQRMGPRHA